MRVCSFLLVLTLCTVSLSAQESAQPAAPTPPAASVPGDLFMELAVHRAVLIDVQARLYEAQQRLYRIERLKASEESRRQRVAKWASAVILPALGTYLTAKYGGQASSQTSALLASTASAAVVALAAALRDPAAP